MFSEIYRLCAHQWFQKSLVIDLFINLKMWWILGGNFLTKSPVKEAETCHWNFPTFFTKTSPHSSLQQCNLWPWIHSGGTLSGLNTMTRCYRILHDSLCPRSALFSPDVEATVLQNLQGKLETRESPLETVQKSSGDGAPNLQISAPHRGQTCLDSRLSFCRADFTAIPSR